MLWTRPANLSWWCPCPHKCYSCRLSDSIPHKKAAGHGEVKMKAVPNARVRVEKSNLQLEVCGECAASTNLNQCKQLFWSDFLCINKTSQTWNKSYGHPQRLSHPIKGLKVMKFEPSCCRSFGFCVSGASWVKSSAYKSALKFFRHNSQKSNAGNVCVRHNLLTTKAANATSSSQAFGEEQTPCICPGSLCLICTFVPACTNGQRRLHQWHRPVSARI